MQRSNLKNIYILLFILFTLIFIHIPVIEINSNNNFNAKLYISDVYYEDTDNYAYGAYVSGDFAYIADRDSGLAIFN